MNLYKKEILTIFISLCLHHPGMARRQVPELCLPVCSSVSNIDRFMLPRPFPPLRKAEKKDRKSGRLSESECKGTTIFRTGKTFLYFFLKKSERDLCGVSFANKYIGK